MVQGTPQFTPSQVLDAGRRAEAEGKIDYAIQFYRHLTDHYAYTQEAAGAREALARLGPPRASSGAVPLPAPNWRGGPPPPHVNGDHTEVQPRPPLVRPGRQTSEAEGRNYRSGRIIAKVVTACGWIAFAGGAISLALGVAAIMRVGGVASLPGVEFASIVGPAYGAVSMVFGLGVVLVGQLARAIFDIAGAKH